MLKYLIIISVPLIFIANVWQSKRYNNTLQEISKLNRQQISIVEENKKLISEIARYSSPSRIDRLADEEYQLTKISPGRILRIIVPETELNP